MPLRIAHRGMPRQIRENTLAGFALALELGADGIELDVHATRDGHIVVHHDPALADGSAITTLTLAELGGREAAPGIAIPTLDDVCTLVAGRASIFVEIKGAGIEAQVVETMRRHEGEMAIHAFDHAMIARLAAASCPYPLGVLFEGRVEELARVMSETGARDVWPHYPLATHALVNEVHARGGRVIAWTVNDADVARTLAATGVDGLCGDDVSLFSDTLSRPRARL